MLFEERLKIMGGFQVVNCFSDVARRDEVFGHYTLSCAEHRILEAFRRPRYLHKCDFILVDDERHFRELVCRIQSGSDDLAELFCGFL